jgi:hypothetical protein
MSFRTTRGKTPGLIGQSQTLARRAWMDVPTDGWRRVTSESSKPGAHLPTARRTFPLEFKAEAVKLVTEQGRSFVEAAVNPPGRGQAAHDGARHLEKSDGLLRQGLVMRYGFVESHRGRWPVRMMCRVLRSPPRATTTGEEAAEAVPRGGGDALDRAGGTHGRTVSSRACR